MEKQTLAVGFADLSHFARLMEAVGSERAVGILQEAYMLAGDSILKFGGQIRKYIGDAILFTFADPRQAIHAAEAIAAGYRREVNAIPLRFRVAVATGEVYVGQIGHPAHRSEDILGETVNRAALLLKEAAHSETGVALCEETKKYR